MVVVVVCLLALSGCDELFKEEPPPVILENMTVVDGYLFPDLEVTLMNRSSKPVQAVSFWASFTDGHNRPVKGLAGDPAHNMRWQRETIPPNGTVRGTWGLVWFDLATRVDDSGVCLVTFTDGNQWKPRTPHSNC